MKLPAFMMKTSWFHQICCFISLSVSNVNTEKHNTKALAFSFPFLIAVFGLS